VVGELVVADQRGERRAAEGAVLLLVDLLEESGLIELRRPLEILQEVLSSRRSGPGS
jgi:hypothetical protein